MAAAFCATMLAEMRMVMLAASRGAKGLSRFMAPGKHMLSPAPSATGANTTCMLAIFQSSPQFPMQGSRCMEGLPCRLRLAHVADSVEVACPALHRAYGLCVGLYNVTDRRRSF